MRRVLIVDDQRYIRKVCAMALIAAGLDVVGEASDAYEAIALAEGLQPDVVVLDVKMPGLSGIEAIPRIRVVAPKTKVIIYTSYGDDEIRNQAFAAGADAYLERREGPPLLSETVRRVCEGPPTARSSEP